MDDQAAKFRDALRFIENIDSLKNTYRKNLILNRAREESTAEHSFSLAMAVLCFGAFSDRKIDLMKTVKMALFHDLAEGLTGDTFHYDKNKAVQEASEREALETILVPIAGTALYAEILALWEEFENGDSPEALFLRGLDRMLPIFHNYKTDGHTWLKHGITKDMALKKNAHIEDGSKLMWEATKAMLDEAQSKGWLAA
jgi:putative hydrolase of HD superfamily